MKLIQFIAPFLAVATTWADQEKPRVFFAKVNDILVPLSGMYLGERFENVSIFSYGEPLVGPTEFAFENGVAYTTQKLHRQSVGFYDDNLVFGREVLSGKLNLDSDWQVLNRPFYSCKLLTGPAHVIFTEINDRRERVSYCFEVKIYFLPYDKGIKSAVIPKDPPKLDVVPRKSCTLHFHGKNALANLAGFLKTYDGECDVYVNGEQVRLL